MLSAHHESHKRMRDVLVPKFTPRQANANRELMRRVISQLLDEWAPKGSFDFEDFASFFPITVMCTMIGAPPSAIPSLKASLEALGLSASMKLEHVPALQEGYVIMDDFVRDLVARRRDGERLRAEPDLLDDLIGAVDSGGISEQELYDLLVFLFVAGYDTSKNMLTLIMDQMVDQPDLYRRCAEDPGICRKVMDETLRWFSPGTIPRVTSQDVTYRDVVLPKGTPLFFPVSIAGRDPDAFAEPDRFDPEMARKARHMAFGRGMHICLGQFIARAQIEEGLHLIARRLRNPHQTAPNGWRGFLGVWGLNGLPLAFEDTGADASSPEAVAA
jgi:cytochrome P450